MNILILLLGVVGCGLGLLSSLYIIISLPATLIWKLVQYTKGNREVL